MAALPRVEGRHRNRALAAARRSRAIQLRTPGWTYEQIADQLAFANRGTVCRIVNGALAAREVEAVEDVRGLERERLDTLQVALWDKAMTGDTKAAQSVLGIIMARVRLLGLDVASAGHRPRRPRRLSHQSNSVLHLLRCFCGHLGVADRCHRHATCGITRGAGGSV